MLCVQVSCYTTARIDRLLFSEAEQEAAGPGQLEAASLTSDSARGLDQFGGCLSSLTRCGHGVLVVVMVTAEILAVRCN